VSDSQLATGLPGFSSKISQTRVLLLARSLSLTSAHSVQTGHICAAFLRAILIASEIPYVSAIAFVLSKHMYRQLAMVAI
jgi:hypothetical protein